MTYTTTFDSGNLLTSAEVALEIELWLDGATISDNCAQSIASYFMTSRPHDVFSLIAHGQAFDPEFAKFEIAHLVRMDKSLTDLDKTMLLALDALISRTMALVIQS